MADVHVQLALADTIADEVLRTALFAQFVQLGEHMRNRPGAIPVRQPDIP